MNNKSIASSKLYSVEFVRFIFAGIIVYYHILHSNIKGFADGMPIYQRLYDNCALAGSIVEAFFIISGYFLFKSFLHNPNISIKEFAYNKFARLWPMLALYLIIGFIFFHFNAYECFYNALFLQAVGVTPTVSGITWYVSPLFFSMIFLFALFKNFKNKNKFNLFLGVLVYFSYTALVNNCGIIFSRHNIYGFLSLSVLRAIAGLGAGYLIGVITESFKRLDYIKNYKGNWFTRAVAFLVVSAVELTSFYYMMRHFFDSQNSMKQEFFFVLLFVLFFLCLLSRKGIFTLLFNNKLFGFAGKYAYSIYIMQQISFYILQRIFWNNSAYVQNHFVRTLLISTAFSILFGIAAYYIVEKPSAYLLNKFGKKLFGKSNCQI